MTDYISRQAAIDIAYPFDDSERNLQDALEDIPSADVVEVVRCKDCKYGHLRDNTKRNSSIYCDFGIGVHKENYCSYGERADT